MKRHEAWISRLIVFSLAGFLMGNEGCEKQEPPSSQERVLRRRVQLRAIKAPPIELPAQAGRKNFDFEFVVNAQMHDILSKTHSFTTATIDPNDLYDPSQLSEEGKQYFNSCGDDPEDNASFLDNVRGKVVDVGRSAACMIDMPQAVVEGSILDFALTNSANVSLGLSEIPFLSGLSFEFHKYELSAELKAKAPLERGNHYLSTVQEQKFKKDWGAGFNLNFGQIALGPRFYFSSPLRKVVDETMTAAVAKLRDNWSKDEPWYTTIIRNCDKFIYINGGHGNDVGLRVGDIVQIKNVKYFWEGERCNSFLNHEMVVETVAYARVTSVGRNISEAWIIENDQQNYPRMRASIYPGSRVYMHQMVETLQPPKK